MGAHSYSKGSATGGSEEAAKYKKKIIQSKIIKGGYLIVATFKIWTCHNEFVYDI